MVLGTQGPNPIETPTLADLNTALGTKLKNFFGLEWIDANTVLVSEDGKYYTSSLASKSGKICLLYTSRCV